MDQSKDNIEGIPKMPQICDPYNLSLFQIISMTIKSMQGM